MDPGNHISMQMSMDLLIFTSEDSPVTPNPADPNLPSENLDAASLHVRQVYAPRLSVECKSECAFELGEVREIDKPRRKESQGITLKYPDVSYSLMILFTLLFTRLRSAVFPFRFSRQCHRTITAVTLRMLIL